MKQNYERYIDDGVMIIDPACTYIDENVTIGAGTKVYPGTYLEGGVTIGTGCVIGPNTKISGSRLGNGVTAEFSVILNAKIGNGTTVGPFAYVRPDTVVGDNCRIGDFVEIKNSVIGNGTKVSHLTYVGDSDVGRQVNFGCGTVTVNYDGAKKHRTTIGDNVFLGCNTNLVAPVTVADGGYTAAGSTITEDVPENALAVARARQVNKTGWKRKANTANC